MTKTRFFNELEFGSYNSLFFLIRKNTRLKKAVNAITSDDEGMNKLLDEVKHGHLSQNTFSNKDCDIHLLRLFKDEKISYSEFFTTYSYLMALIATNNVDYQYEDLKKLDEIKNVETFNLWDEGKDQLSEFGKDYIKRLCSNYVSLKNFMGEESQAIKKLANEAEEKGLSLEDMLYNNLERYISQLNPVERIVIKLDLPNNEFVGQFAMAYPCVSNMQDNHISLYSPSYAIHDWISKQASKEPMRIQVCFGRLTRETLLDWHQNNVHPYPVCNRLVKSNMVEAHGDNYDPYTIAQHDLFHVFVASLAPKEDRAHILAFSEFLLKLRNDLDVNPVEPKAFNDKLKHAFDGGFDELNDLLLIGYKGEWREIISGTLHARVMYKEFDKYPKEIHQYFVELNKQNLPKEAKIAIESTISDLEAEYSELTEQKPKR